MRKSIRGIVGLVLTLALMATMLLTPAYALTADELKILLQEYYIDDVSEEVLQQDTIQGILEALGDVYTRYMTEEEYTALLNSMSDQEISGIGITSTSVEEGLMVMIVHKDSAAEKAGLQTSDIIVAVDGKTTAGVDPTEVSSWLRGEPGTTVQVKILHTDGKTQSYTMTRQTVVIPSTTSELLDGHIGYINCTTFGDTTLEHFQDAMALNDKVNVWVVDMRTNLGGDVWAVSQSLGVFLGKGNVAYMRNGNDEYIAFASEQDAKTSKPVIVLTSPYTASSAEIFASVIRDSENGILIGSKTYGKGVAQVVLTKKEMPAYFAQGDAVAITAFRYFTPSGSTADQIGVIPHLLVDPVIAGDVAVLLSEKEPSSPGGYLNISLGYWRWYVNLDVATTDKNRPIFKALLEALPPGAEVKLGSVSGWSKTDVKSLVDTYQLSGYTDRSFGDVGTDTRAQKINTLGTYDIVRGYGEGAFQPEGNMTRAELSALLVQAMGLSKKGQISYHDVASDAWFAESVNIVTTAGLMQGTGNGAFSPQGTVTEEELFTVLARAGAMLNTYMYERSKTWDANTMSVAGNYSSWSKQWVWLLSNQKTAVGGKKNLLFAESGSIDAKRAATRGEAAEVLYNIYTHIGILKV